MMPMNASLKASIIVGKVIYKIQFQSDSEKIWCWSIGQMNIGRQKVFSDVSEMRKWDVMSCQPVICEMENVALRLWGFGIKAKAWGEKLENLKFISLCHFDCGDWQRLEHFSEGRTIFLIFRLLVSCITACNALHYTFIMCPGRPYQAIQGKFTCSNNCSNSLTMAHNDSAVCTRLCNKSLGFCYTILWTFLTPCISCVGSPSLISKLLALSKYWYWCFIRPRHQRYPGHNSLWHQILCDKKFNIVANCRDKGRRNRHNFLADASSGPVFQCQRMMMRWS